MTALHLHPTSDAVEEALRAELQGGGIVELGLGRATPRQLVEAAFAAGGGGAERLGPVAQWLVVDAIAERARGAFAGVAGTRGLKRGIVAVASALGRAGADPRVLGGSDEGRELARCLAQYHKQLDAAGLIDDAAAWRLGCRAIAEGAPLPMLADVETVETHDLLFWDAGELLLLDALLRRGLGVRVHVPASAELPASATRALAPLYAALEARHGADRLERVEAPLGRAAVTFTEAPSPAIEARQLARTVRDLLDGGTAPEAIAVVAESGARQRLVAGALERYGVPVARLSGYDVLTAPPVRVALDLLQLADDGVPRERFIELISSRYVAGEARGPNGKILPHQIAAALREAGCGDNRDDGYSARLAAWARRRSKHLLRSGNAMEICRHVDHLLTLVGSLPAEATLERHAARLSTVLGKLELPRRTRAFAREDHLGDVGEGVDATRALGRDQAALYELETLLAELPRAAARVGLRAARTTRARFARVLEELLAERRPRRPGARGAAVEIGGLAAFAGRRARRLFVCGLVDGELPGRASEDALFADEDRVAANRAAAQPLLPLSSRAADEQALRFFVSIGGAETAALSWSLGNADGAPALVSPLVDELAPQRQATRLRRDLVPRFSEARSLDELWARVMLDGASAAAAAWLPLLGAHARDRLLRLEHLAAVERQRHRFFLGQVDAHAYVGRLREPALLAELGARSLPGRHDDPLSATRLETYARCPFAFFLTSVLRAREREEADEEIDHRALGLLAHQVLERLFRRFVDGGLLPLTGKEEERDLAEDVCDEIVAEWRATEALGHPGLFAVKERRMRQEIAALLAAEVDAPPSPDCRPTHFERAFGPMAFGDVWLKGKIDRIDLGADRAVVLDYKSGSKLTYSPQLAAEALCDTAWQLPIYAAVVERELELPVVEARFYSLRDAEVTRPVAAPADLTHKLAEVHAAMRAGGFVVAPRQDACERCGMEAACRVRHLASDEDQP